MAGYYGYSMSNNAKQCYDNGIMPKSKWTKEKIIEQISSFYDEEVTKLFSFFINSILSISSTKEIFLKYDSWHHTSKFYNCTEFYRIDIYPLFKNTIKPQNKKEAKKHYNDFINLINNNDLTFIETLQNNGFSKDIILYFLYEHTECSKEYIFFNKLKEVFILDEKDMDYLIEKKVQVKDFSILNDENYEVFLKVFYGNFFYEIVKDYRKILSGNLELFVKYYPKAKEFCKEVIERNFINYECLEYSSQLLELMKKCGFEKKEILRFEKSIYIAKECKKISSSKDIDFFKKFEKIFDLACKYNATMCVDFVGFCNHYEVFPEYLNTWSYMLDEHKNKVIKNKIQELKYFQNPTDEKRKEVEILWLKLLKETSKAVRMIDERLLTDDFLAKAYVLREWIFTQLNSNVCKRISVLLDEQSYKEQIIRTLKKDKLLFEAI